MSEDCEDSIQFEGRLVSSTYELATNSMKLLYQIEVRFTFAFKNDQ